MMVTMVWEMIGISKFSGHIALLFVIIGDGRQHTGILFGVSKQVGLTYKCTIFVGNT